MTTKRTNHSVYNLNYHTVTVDTFRAFPRLKKTWFWGSGLFSDGTYYGSAGAVSAEIIKRYIAEQKLA